MKKKILFTAIALCVGASTFAQNTFPAIGNVGIGSTNPTAKITFNDVNDNSNGADGISWYSTAPLNYGIYRTPGAWQAPSFQQLKLQWDTGIIISPGTGYEKSYVDINGDGLRVSTGNVGIGTVSPSAKLEIVSSSNNNQISLTKNSIVGGEGPGMVFRNLVNDGTQPEIAKIQSTLLNGAIGNVAASLSFLTKYNSADVLAMTIAPTGNVGIGINNPAEKLSVNGNIRAKEVKVETANWPDYVFEKGYKVGTLEDLESYIKENKHLPEIPAANEVNANGVELGEMNKLLLKKVEELTLYLIEKEKQIKLLQLENSKQQNKSISDNLKIEKRLKMLEGQMKK